MSVYLCVEGRRLRMNQSLTSDLRDLIVRRESAAKRKRSPKEKQVQGQGHFLWLFNTLNLNVIVIR